MWTDCGHCRCLWCREGLPWTVSDSTRSPGLWPRARLAAGCSRPSRADLSALTLVSSVERRPRSWAAGRRHPAPRWAAPALLRRTTATRHAWALFAAPTIRLAALCAAPPGPTVSTAPALPPRLLDLPGSGALREPSASVPPACWSQVKPAVRPVPACPASVLTVSAATALAPRLAAPAMFRDRSAPALLFHLATFHTMTARVGATACVAVFATER